MERIEPGPDQQSVWDFPDAPRITREERRIRIYVGGIPVVNSTQGLRAVVHGHPPSYYLPTQDFKHCEIRRLKHHLTDEHIGVATVFTIIAGGKIAHRALWSFLAPHGPYRRLTSHMGVHPGRVDRVYLGEQMVLPQENPDLPGWVTSDIVGPFMEP